MHLGEYVLFMSGCVCVWGGRGALVASKMVFSDVENKTGLVKGVKKLRCCLADQFSQLSKKCNVSNQ